MEWMNVEKGENGTLLWTWPLLVVLMNGEARAGMGDKPDKSVFVAALQMRRNSDRFTSRRKALRSAMLPPPHQMFWLLINNPGFLTCTNMFVFIHRYMLICFVHRSMWQHAHLNFLKGNKQAVCLYLWCTGMQSIMQSIMQSLYMRITFERAALMGSSGVVYLADRGQLQLKQRW